MRCAQVCGVLTQGVLYSTRTRGWVAVPRWPQTRKLQARKGRDAGFPAGPLPPPDPSTRWPRQWEKWVSSRSGCSRGLISPTFTLQTEDATWAESA